jgi:aspartate/methionine/tyrosine aminotransferase
MQSPIIPIVGEWVRDNPQAISLGQGVVGYGPPPQAAHAVTQFLTDDGYHKYQPVEGIAPLITIIEEKLQRENGIAAGQNSGSRVVVTAGANMAFFESVLAVTDPGDEVILPSPFYFNHEMAITMAGCRPVPIATDADYQLRLDALEAAVTPRTRALLTVSPANPTGAVYPGNTLRAVNELCHRHGLFHISDEPYEYFVHGNAPHFSPGSIPGAAGHTISLFSLSKAYGFASWRIGYMVVPNALMEAVRKIQDTNLICPPAVSQFAAVGALEAGRPWCQERINQISDVRRLVLAELDALQRDGLCSVPPADGAFYVLLKVHTARNDIELVEQLIREHGVAVLPGSAFGAPNDDARYLRVAYGALDKNTVAEGVGRLVRGLRAVLAVKE